MYAVANGRRELVEILLKSGANVNAQDKWGITALMYAVLEGRRELAELLLSRGADIHVRAKKGLTALMCATRENMNSSLPSLRTDIIKLLVEHGAHIHEAEDEGKKEIIDWIIRAVQANNDPNILNLTKKFLSPGWENEIRCQQEKDILTVALERLRDDINDEIRHSLEMLVNVLQSP